MYPLYLCFERSLQLFQLQGIREGMVPKGRMVDGLVDAVPSLRPNSVITVHPALLVRAGLAHRLPVCISCF